MSKYIQFILVILYAALTISTFFIVIDVFGWLHKPLRDSLVLLTIFIWLLLSFSAAWFLTGFFLLFMNTRKPILEEEQRLGHSLEDIQKRANDNARYRLMIQEEMGMDAFAIGYRTIVVSRGLLNELTDFEIKAVMAHELGHLTSKDCVASMAYFLTGYLPRNASFICRLTWRRLKRYFSMLFLPGGLSRLGGLLGRLILIGFALFYFHLAKYMEAILFYILLLHRINHLFRFLWKLNSRHTEYRQDAFAQKLGLGNDLRVALCKLIGNVPQKVNFFYIFQCEHPFMHNRIRRLEKMEGLRE